MVMRTRMMAEIISSVSFVGLGGGEVGVFLSCFGRAMSKVVSLEFWICR
jgi:hypothetical protein